MTQIGTVAIAMTLTTDNIKRLYGPEHVPFPIRKIDLLEFRKRKYNKENHWMNDINVQTSIRHFVIKSSQFHCTLI